MEFSHIFTLSFIQGVTEFLPISSSAHLVLTPYFAKWSDQGMVFDIGVHLGTLFAVLLYFKQDVCRLASGGRDVLRRKFSTGDAKALYLLIIGTLPLLVFGYLLKDVIENYARALQIIAFTSIFYALLLWWADAKHGQEKTDVTSKRDALVFGLFQMLAVLPGTSRSGICMTAGRYLGFSRDASARFAMLLAIPSISAVGGYYSLKVFLQGDASVNPVDFALGVVLSFASAYAVISLLMRWVGKIGFMPFIVYRIALGCFLFYLSFSL